MRTKAARTFGWLVASGVLIAALITVLSASYAKARGREFDCARVREAVIVIYSRASFITLVDPDERRRKAITSHLAPWARHVEEHRQVGELMHSWPRFGLLMVFDDGTGAQLLQEAMIKRGTWRAHVFYSNMPQAPRIADAVLRGAIDYLGWPFDRTELAARVPLWRNRAAASAARHHRQAKARKRVQSLTLRETQILSLVARGLTDQEIGDRLGISHRTSQIHRANMLAKLGVNRSTAAVRMAIDARLDGNLGRGPLIHAAPTISSLDLQGGDERWRPAPNSPTYEVSSFGRIRNANGVLKPPTRRGTELVVNLYANGESNVRNVRSIVAEAFLGPRNSGEMVAHKDGDRTNCTAENLVYVPMRNRGPKDPEARRNYAKRKLTARDVADIRKRAAGGEQLSQLAREFGVSVPHISNISNGLRWRSD